MSKGSEDEKVWIDAPQEPRQCGFAVVIRLRRSHDNKQGEWALAVQPHADSMANWNLQKIIIEDLRSGKTPFPDNTMVFDTQVEAAQQAEAFENYAGFYASGDYETFAVLQRIIAIYRGWEKG